MDHLFHGTKPSSMPHDIELNRKIHSPETMIRELSSVDYVRKCRGNIRIIETKIASYRLAKKKKWLQMFFDGKIMRQASMISLSVAISEEGSPYLMLIFLSCSHHSMDETSEGTVPNIESILKEEKTHLERWRVSFKTLFPGVDRDTPLASNLTLTNENNVSPVTDTYNPENKARELLDTRIGDVYKKLMTCVALIFTLI